jgi:hypothetical protein
MSSRPPQAAASLNATRVRALLFSARAIGIGVYHRADTDRGVTDWTPIRMPGEEETDPFQCQA